MSEGWSLTESDPAIFTALLHDLGAQEIEVEELFNLDDAALDDLQPVYALIFLFKWVAGHKDEPAGVSKTPSKPHYFAHQVINNACATLAILNGVLNIESLHLGPELTQLKEFSQELDPQTRGLVLTNSEKLREVHNSFAKSDPFALEEDKTAAGDEDAYHFIVYTPIGDELYELDGLQQEPRCHGPVTTKDGVWTKRAREVIEARIATYAAGEVHFNLMAICKDRQVVLQDRMNKALSSGAADAETQVAELSMRLDDEKAKRERWAFENSLRKENMVALVHQLLLELAKAGKLEDSTKQAKETMAKLIEKRKKNEQA